jgi:putative aldouronate transport system substrate-binding protein
MVPLAVMMAVAGCTGQDAATPPAQEPKEAVREAFTEVNGIVKYDPPISFTQNFRVEANSNWFVPGNDINNSGFTKWSKEAMGIEWTAKWIAPDIDTDIQKLNLALASKDLPNVVRVQTSNEIIKLAKAGVLLPIKELLDQYGSPLTKFIYEEADKATGGQFFGAVTYNGVVYGIPSLSDVWSGTTQTLWIRKDILDKLGLEVPKTLAEYEAAMEAYKGAYPDGIGLHLTKDFLGMEAVMNAVGAFPKKWVDGEDGGLVYGSVQPEVKTGLSQLQKWYKNGWLHKEFIVQKDVQQVIAGNALSVYGPWWYVHANFENLIKNVPEAVMVPVPLFRESAKAGFVNVFPFARQANAITVGTEHPEAVIYQLNAVMESTFRSHADLREKFPNKYPADEHGGIKYDMPGPRYFNFPNSDGKQIDSYHTYFGIKLNERSTELYDSFQRANEARKANKADTLTGMDLFRMNVIEKRGTSLGHFLHMDLWNAQNKDGVYRLDKFVGEPTPTMLSKNAFLTKLEGETFAKIIMGAAPIDEFDAFVTQWMESGGSDIVKEVNEWYKANQ